MMPRLLLVAVLAACGGVPDPEPAANVPAVAATTMPRPTETTTTTTIPVYAAGDPVPSFVTAAYFPTDVLVRVSRFRSGAGHGWGPGPDQCVSLKHYFVADPSLDHTAIEIRSPVDGVVEEILAEQLADGGSQLRIRVDAAPAFRVILFHVRADVIAGDRVRAGDLLGHHIGNFTGSDIAVVGDLGDNEFAAISVFEVMTDDVFAEFVSRGATSRELFIITAEERAADPLSCDAVGTFADPGTIENWVVLGDAP